MHGSNLPYGLMFKKRKFFSFLIFNRFLNNYGKTIIVHFKILHT